MKAGNLQDRITQEALSGLMGKLGDTPIARHAIRYWWLSVPVAWAMYSQFKKRQCKGEACTFNFLQDFGALIGPIAALIAINEVATKHEETIYKGPITDAQFSTVTPDAE